ncbi:MAG: leucine-rich repeat protein [Victivallales bacterium]
MGKNSFWNRLLLVAFITFTFAVSATAEQYGKFTYTDNGADITITKYTQGYGGFENVTIPGTIDGKPVTGIGDEAFYNCYNISIVTIPASVTYIGKDVFSYCDSLSSINVDALNPSYIGVDGILFSKDKTTLIQHPSANSGNFSYTVPDSVTTISSHAFAGCRGLTSVTIPASVTSIGEGALSYCRFMSSINVDALNPSYCSVDGILFNKDKTALIQHPTGRGGSFGYTVPDGVASIGSHAFAYCDGLASVTIPDGVASIGRNAFAYCDGLISVPIPASVTSIGEYAFAGCRSMSSINVDALNPSYSSADGILFDKNLTVLIRCPVTKTGSYTIPASVKTIANSSFFDCSKLTRIIIPGGVTSIGGGAFCGCTGLTGGMTIPDGVTSIEVNTFYYCTNLTGVTIPDSVASIGEAAFFDCYKLTSVTIPGSVTSIGDRAFYGCGKLTSVTIPDGITSIGQDTFCMCTSLTSVTIPDSVSSVGKNAFSWCSSLGSIAIPDSVTSIGEDAFYDCIKLTSVTIGTGVTAIGNRSFTDCTSLTSITVGALNPTYSSVDGVVFNKSQTMLLIYPCGKAGSYTIPDGVTNIDDGAFIYCTKLTGVKIPDSVTSIGQSAFCECSKLTTVAIGAGVTSIGDDAFYKCSKLTSVTIPDSVTSIGDGTFSWCTSLGCVTIPDSVTSIGQDVFYECTSLTSVTIGAGVTSIGDYAFSWCTSLDRIDIPDSVTSIGQDVFYECTSLTSATIGAGITGIWYDRFSDSTCLTSITVGSLNPTYSSVDGVVFNKDKTTLIQCPNGKAGSYTIPDSVTSIEYNAFNGCAKLTGVTIPDSVTSIGYYAFYECSKLIGVTIPGSVTDIGYNAFKSCTGLTRAVFLGDAPSMQTEVFVSCASNFTVYYIDGTPSFTSPTWEGYPSATFTHPVVFTAGANGSIAGMKTQAVKYDGNCAKVTAVPDADYHFTGWTGSYAGTANPLTLSNVSTSMMITANFALNTATLKLLASGNGTAGATSVNPLNTATAIPILATPGANSHFVNWTVTSGLATIAGDKLAATAVTLTGDHESSVTITANFADNTTIPTAVPAAPIVSASDGTYEDRVIITWKPVPTATSYEVYRNTTKLAPLPEDRLGEVSDGIFEDNTADAGTTYYYFARAKNSIDWGKFSAGNSGYVAKAPAVPGAVTASDGKYFDKIRVSWAKVAGATSYKVFRTDSATPAPDPLVATPLAETTALFIDDFGDDIVPMDGVNVKNYYYWLAAKNANGTTVISKPNIGYLSNKGPVSITASNGTYSDRIAVNWKAVPGATAYDVYRYTDAKFTQNPTRVGDTIAVLAYEDTPVAAGTLFYYKVNAKYEPGNYDSALSLTGAIGKASGSSNSKATNINNGDTSSNIASMAKGGILYFSTEVPVGTTRLVAILNGTSNLTANDCNVYAKFANYPTVSSFNAKGVENIASEILTVSNPAVGTWYFMLYGVTEYSDVTLTVNCYSVADIVLTQIPVNDLPVPSKAVFKGKVVDESGAGIPKMTLQVRNPITGLTSTLVKTNAKGFFSYSTAIGSEGEHTFDFFFTDMPDTAKGTASHTVSTRKGCLEDNDFFDSSAYIPAVPVEVPLQTDIIGLQNFLNIRNGWTDGAIDGTYETMWVESTLAKAKDDTQLEDQLETGLNLLLYGVEGTGVGNDTTTTSALSAVPFVVHVESLEKQTVVLDALNALGIIDGTQKTDIENGDIGIIAVTSLSDPGEGLTPVDISLLACEQLELLAKLAAGDASFVEDKTYSGVASKILTVTLSSGRQINVVVAGFVK